MLIARRDMVSKVSVATDILVTKGYSNFNDPKNPRALITLDSVKATNGAISEALRIRDKGSEAYQMVMVFLCQRLKREVQLLRTTTTTNDYYHELRATTTTNYDYDEIRLRRNTITTTPVGVSPPSDFC